MTTKTIEVSQFAAVIYAAAESSEIKAVCAYVFDTLEFDGKEYDVYNKWAADNLSLSLGTMRNRATAARAIQKKYGTTIVQYAVQKTDAAIADFTNFISDEMKKAGEYYLHVEDIKNFIAEKKPAHVQRKEEADRVKATREAMKQAEAEKAKKAAEEKAKRDADMSGTPTEPSNANPQPEGTDIGNPPAGNPDPAQVTDKAPEPRKTAPVSALVVARLTEDARIEVEVANDCDTSTLEDIVSLLMQTIEQRRIMEGLEKKAA